MNTQTLTANLPASQRASHALNTQGYPSRACFILKLLDQLKHGALHLQLPDGQSAHFGDDSYPVTLHLRDWSLFDAVMKYGDIGFAETYLANGWTTDNLTGLIELFIKNREQIETLIYGKWWGNLLYRLRHLFHRNSRSGSRKNIHAHYDIGNDFYRLWLDPSMTYSSALFDHGNTDDLQAGQLAKYRRIVQQLRLQRGDRVLEIGCGWGGFAEVAAQEAGVRITGLTLSTEQLAYAQRRMDAAGLSNQTELKLLDYRDCHGKYDAIASIEMFEAVGEAYWPNYFECVARNLKLGGRACIQTIVIADALFERYRSSTDFIQQYIFPGGMLPSPGVFREQAARQGLRVVDEFAFGLDYARTLAEWRTAFYKQLPEVRAQGFDERFVLTWEFYLCYCEAAFRAGSTNVMHFTLEKA
ncbi:class I SAM-dependent methyltransferase [Ferrigenium sp. UT5]|uniref:class I SAM-dependent methyltransferase n=1 Tax=Ferrigenium sp. UT5 TaxID=3242105 RepID=UPI00354BD442